MAKRNGVEVVETVTVTTKDGKVQIFDISVDPAAYRGERAYIRDTSQYYTMGVFERGLANGKAAKVERTGRL